MAKRGRKARAEFELVAETGVRALTIHRRPEPLAELGELEASVWRETVEAMPADWFPQETWPVLAQFCRHVVQARHVAALIAQFYERQREASAAGEPFELGELSTLLRIQRLESTSIASLAGKMRLTQSSAMRPETAGRRKDANPGAVARPWEFDG